MPNLEMNQPKGKQLAVGIVLAILLGIATPVMTVLEVSLLMPVILLNGVFMAFLYCYAGRMPSWLYMTIQLGAAAVLMDSTYMWMTMASGVFPGILALRGIMLKRPFFEQMRVDITASLLGLLAAIVIARLSFGGNMVGRMLDALREQFNHMPDDLFSPFVDAINRALPEGAIVPMTVSGYRERIMAVLEVVGETYAQLLPGRLLSGAALTGLLTALWGNWLMARRGMATDDSYIGLSQWFLPAQVVAGLLAIWFAGFFISMSEYSSKMAAYVAVYDLVSTAFCVQGLGAIDRFLIRRGTSGGKRHVLVVLAVVLGMVFRLLSTALFMIGAASALFGSHGIAKRRPHNNDKNDTMGGFHR